jgi:hypothetical protein
MRTPSRPHPRQGQRRTETVTGAVRGQHREHVFEGFRILAEDPITVLAHHGQTVKHHGLTAGQQGPRTTGIEVAGQLQVDVEFVVHKLSETRVDRSSVQETGNWRLANLRRATGVPMLGAIGKTDYAVMYRKNWLPGLSNGRWVR